MTVVALVEARPSAARRLLYAFPYGQASKIDQIGKMCCPISGGNLEFFACFFSA
jgi:hypothetical protein